MRNNKETWTAETDHALAEAVHTVGWCHSESERQLRSKEQEL